MSNLPDRPGRSAAVAAFLQQVARLPQVKPASGRRGRLIFAIDATASRQPSWDRACQLQGEMFLATREMGGLEVQLAYYRGFLEFAATPFLADAAELARRMTGVQCLGGQTQIQRVLDHALAETRKDRVHALVFVGDAVEEPVDPLCHAAGQLGLCGTPVFCFHEGGDLRAGQAFRQIAKVSGGAYAVFDAGSAEALRALLRAVAVYAAGGRAALARLPGAAASRIAGQLPAPKG
ncbi:VWA domain-containing protein [Siccirubricoccus sp. KC 17139]|uniref:VWA domain-containing protein n=1 Tax=Siccirubricoccus soli TaxID=2899147 RepID=A0ABT1D4H0_9PROT|nr:VWA domain-containing protein [Siccirubricoccus soli]MCO6416764.1 VWA domain-containing protein [Siccirubricoccus soli]MCP2682899.1 VWA domain-containing protein [Siccirubricoccus soli]